MELVGQVEDIIYKNDINSYTIATFETDEEILTIVGYLPFINSGDSLKIIGKYVTHKDYGEQFKIDTFEKLMPKDLKSLEKYLANSDIKGVGPATAKKIVDRFGDDTISVFKFEPYKLALVKGITKERALEIAEEFNSKWEVWQIVSFLEKFGIGANNAKKIYDELGTNAIEEIEANPYVLIDIVRGVDFKQIDKMAIDLGFAYNNGKRVRSGIKYALILATYNGNSCTKKGELKQFVIELLNIDEDDFDTEFINLKVKNEVIVEQQEEFEYVYLYDFYKVEEDVALKLKNLANAKNIKKVKNIKAEILKQEQISNIFLSEKQKEAIEEVNENNVCIITGGPGTGKTTIIKNIIEIYKSHGRKVVLCAPTGRAAKRMSETTGEEAKTLHRLLEIGKFEEDRVANIDYEVAPIDSDIIVVDEVSMVDMFLMNYLLKAIYQGTKLVLVGDVDQLPSVGPGNVLKDIINSKQICTVTLNKIFRQAAASKIIVNAHKVNNGINFIKNKHEELENIEAGNEKIEEKEQDFFYINEWDQDKILYQIKTLCKSRLKNYGDYDFFKNIQVLTPTKKGMLGTRELNKALQEELNPESDDKKEKSSLTGIIRELDRVMQIKNNYDLYWERTVGAGPVSALKQEQSEIIAQTNVALASVPAKEDGHGIFNGEFGIVEKIDNENKKVKIKFDDDKIAWYDFNELDQIEHSYSITIHKSQRK